MPIDIKICGLKTLEAVSAAVDGGAAYVGFVFFPPSPRAITPSDLTRLTAPVPTSITRVALFVDATFEEIGAVVDTNRIDMLQLHGKETPGTVAKLKAEFGLPVMKAVAMAGEDDIVIAREYEITADQVLFDAKPPKGATRPGGNALKFDWELIAEKDWVLPWMLAGGIDSSNLAEAVYVSGAAAIDVSSGVEDAPGEKNTQKIKELLALAKTL